MKRSVVICLALSSFSTPFSSCSSSQPCHWTSFSIVVILMQDDRDLWLCCFSSSAHIALNFHPLLMLYSFRRPPELLQVTQKHTSATTEYAQRVKGRQTSKKTMFKLSTTTGLSGLFTLFFLLTPLTLQTLWKPAVLCHIIENTIQCWWLIRRLLEATNSVVTLKSSLSSWHALFYFCLAVHLDCMSGEERQMNTEQDVMDIWESIAPHRLYNYCNSVSFHSRAVSQPNREAFWTPRGFPAQGSVAAPECNMCSSPWNSCADIKCSDSLREAQRNLTHIHVLMAAEEGEGKQCF